MNNKSRWSALLAAAAAAVGGTLIWARQRPRNDAAIAQHVEEVPASGRSLSAQPRKRVRLAQPTPDARREVPAPDSAEEGRTPYYFVPGEALVSLHGEGPAGEEALRTVATELGGEYAPIGAALVQFPAPEGDGWFTLLRVRWPAEANPEATLARFVQVEAQLNAGMAWGTTRAATWMPNWLGTVAADPVYTPGGPGAYPRPHAPPADGRLPLADAPFLHAWRGAAQHPITLAVVDTFPTADALRERPLPEALQPLVAALENDPGTLSLDAGQHYAAFRTGPAFDMSDHGVMATWLATEIIGAAAMGHVGLLPVRIASAEGVCSAADVMAGLAPLARRAHAGENLVVLLAFVLGLGDIVPPRLRPFEEHYEALRLVCLALSEAGATLVGAAGNDASGLQHPPRTRTPAAFRSIIEVTAGQLQQDNLALYANQAKALCLFGGESNLQNETSDNLPALVGPAVARSVRASAKEVQPNEAGWVAWAGTSFAAALAAGLAVLLRSGTPTLRMWDVRTHLRNVATGTRQPGNVPFVDVVRPV